MSPKLREFARLNPSPASGEGDSAKLSGVRAFSATPDNADPSAEALAKAEADLAQMSERYHEAGDLYVALGETTEG